MDQKAKTGSEFDNLVNSRSVPNTKTATGQNLTREHHPHFVKCTS